MRKILAVSLTALTIFVLSACGAENHDGEAKTPSGSKAQKGRIYQEVVADFEENGFTNIKLEVLDDLILGWLTKDGEVESVCVGGDTDYSSDRWCAADTEVIITYHTFPEKEPEPDAEPTAAAADAEPDTAEEILTAENCPELAQVLSAADDASYLTFAENYGGRTIEFDGSVDYVDHTVIYNPFTGNSRVSEYGYDILLSADDYSDSSQHGPTFKIEDLKSRDVGGDAISDVLPDFISVGSNVRIRARVGNYNEDTGIFTLRYEAIEAR